MENFSIEKALKIIRKFEGCRLTAYYDAVGVLTIGYGHTKNVRENEVITQLEADILLNEDVKDVCKKLNKLLLENGYKINENQYNALISFFFNCGFPRQILKRFKNKVKIDIIIDALLLYTFAGGKKLKGLENRRKAEVELARS